MTQNYLLQGYFPVDQSMEEVQVTNGLINSQIATNGKLEYYGQNSWWFSLYGYENRYCS